MTEEKHKRVTVEIRYLIKKKKRRNLIVVKIYSEWIAVKIREGH